jgi:hypothetical protein
MVKFRTLGISDRPCVGFLACIMLAVGGLQIMVTPAGAQTQQAPIATAPSVDQMALARLIWATMAAIQQANESGNYSVLRDISAPGFQAANDAAKLGQIFANLRATGLDLSNTLLLAPTYRSQPRMVRADMLQVQGFFGLRPTAINFELLYQYVAGRWRLFGVSIAPDAMDTGTAPQKPAGTKPK